MKDNLLYNMYEWCSEDPLCSVAIGCRWAKEPSCIEKFIEDADNLMYEDKKKYYEEKTQQRARRYRFLEKQD